MKTAQEINAELPNFYGTEGYYRWSGLFRNFVLTDGAQYIAEECGAYWLMDAVASHLSSYKNEDFVVATLARGKKVTYFVLTLDDGNGNKLARQVIPYSDFPLDEIKFYVTKSNDLRVIMLPGEY